jgi:protein-tyrosine phosphatase
VASEDARLGLGRRLVRGRRDEPFRLLVVCTGNLCRSPQAEALLRSRIPAAFGGWGADDFRVSSAGTRAEAGLPMDARVIDELDRLGVRSQGEHRSQPVTRALLVRSDLVLAATTAHAEQLEALGRRRVAHHLFTLVGFTVIVEALATSGRGPAPARDDDVASFLRRVVADADANRHVPMPPPVEIDILDPRGYGAEAYRRSADIIDRWVRRLASALRALT